MGKSVMRIDKGFVAHFLTAMPEGTIVSGAKEVSEHHIIVDVSGPLVPDVPEVTGVATAKFNDDRVAEVSWRFDPSGFQSKK
ncbi:hypothetical protein [Agrobacterium sp. M50-1]|uniref:hypothetical protein n=1 Tax=Agrobacterium sp. M50-1 TaxID=3132821 RepID=UPI003CE5C5E3